MARCRCAPNPNTNVFDTGRSCSTQKVNGVAVLTQRPNPIQKPADGRGVRFLPPRVRCPESLEKMTCRTKRRPRLPMFLQLELRPILNQNEASHTPGTASPICRVPSGRSCPSAAFPGRVRGGDVCHLTAFSKSLSSAQAAASVSMKRKDFHSVSSQAFVAARMASIPLRARSSGEVAQRQACSFHAHAPCGSRRIALGIVGACRLSLVFIA